MNDAIVEPGTKAVAAEPSGPIFDLLVIGAGPTGLACAIEAQKAGFRAVLVDKGCICNSLFHYPSHMTFFTTPELLEIGDIPFPSPNAKPNRNEALQYYRQVAAYYRLDMRQYQSRGAGDRAPTAAFTVHTVDRFGRPGALKARKLAIATGYYDLPNYMDIPGENLSKVHHYYVDPHPYFEHGCGGDRGQEFGGHRGAGAMAAAARGSRWCIAGRRCTAHVKYWIKPDIENRIKAPGKLPHFSTQRSPRLPPIRCCWRRHAGNRAALLCCLGDGGGFPFAGTPGPI